jgi:hypothetical protein
LSWAHEFETMMRRGDKFGLAAALLSVFVAIAVLANTSKGRVAQEGFVLELAATAMFVYAGRRGSRWWFAGPVVVVLFWVVAAHVPALWTGDS